MRIETCILLKNYLSKIISFGAICFHQPSFRVPVCTHLAEGGNPRLRHESDPITREGRIGTWFLWLWGQYTISGWRVVGFPVPSCLFSPPYPSVRKITGPRGHEKSSEGVLTTEEQDSRRKLLATALLNLLCLLVHNHVKEVSFDSHSIIKLSNCRTTGDTSLELSR